MQCPCLLHLLPRWERWLVWCIMYFWTFSHNAGLSWWSSVLMTEAMVLKGGLGSTCIAKLVNHNCSENGGEDVLQSHPRDYTFQWTCHFSLLWSNLIISDFELWGDSLWELTYLMPFTLSQHMFAYSKPYAIQLNLILDSSFLCCAWLHCHTHVHHTCLCFSSILPLPCGCLMLLF